MGIHQRFHRRANPREKVTKQRRQGTRSRVKEEMCDGKEEGNSTGQ